MTLKKYREKRKFQETPEPEGGQHEDRGALRFVVQLHRATRLHFDFRLELDGTLKSWAVPKGPSLDPQERRLAVMVEDHPLEYESFEGIIPKGNYGAGTVMVWDNGTYYSRQTPDRDESERVLLDGLKKGHITFILEGKKLKGEFALVKLKRGEENAWLLLKKGDPFASSKDVSGVRPLGAFESEPGRNREASPSAARDMARQAESIIARPQRCPSIQDASAGEADARNCRPAGLSTGPVGCSRSSGTATSHRRD